MYDINTVVLCGRLTKYPELRKTSSGKAVVNFSIAVNNGRDQVDFFEITAWEKTADLCKQYLAKGSQVVVSGRLQQQKWEKEGRMMSKVVVNANSIQFVGGGKKEAEGYSQRGEKEEIPF